MFWVLRKFVRELASVGIVGEINAYVKDGDAGHGRAKSYDNSRPSMGHHPGSAPHFLDTSLSRADGGTSNSHWSAWRTNKADAGTSSNHDCHTSYGPLKRWALELNFECRFGGGKMAGRIAVFIYGVASYLVTLAAFVYAMGFLGNYGVSKSIDSGAQSPFVPALAINLTLLGVFALQHSIM